MESKEMSANSYVLNKNLSMMILILKEYLRRLNGYINASLTLPQQQEIIELI